MKETLVRIILLRKYILMLTVATCLLPFARTPLAQAEAAGCAASAETRQFDYWLGDWNVGGPGASSNSKSTVALTLDKCVFVETWDGGRGHAGQNVFGYSPDDHTWYGMFADNHGRVHIFTQGTVSDGTAEFRGPSRGQNGEAVLNRVKIVRVAVDKVEQTWEKSSDNGGTWNVVFRGEYSRMR